MNGATSTRDRWTPRLLSILRTVTAFVFMEHGTQKLFHFPPAPTPAHIMPGHLAPHLMVAGLLEAFGGLLILVGLFTRPVAFILAGEMAVAYFMVHAKQGFWPLLNRGESAVIYCFVFLYFVAAGGGVWSVDALWGKGS